MVGSPVEVDGDGLLEGAVVLSLQVADGVAGMFESGEVVGASGGDVEDGLGCQGG